MGSAVSFDPYRVLGVASDTSADEVRSAYHRELATAARHGALPPGAVVPHCAAGRHSSRSRAVLVLLLLAGLLSAASWLQPGLAGPDPGGAAVQTVEVTCGPTATTPTSTWTGPDTAVPACPAGATTQVRALP